MSLKTIALCIPDAKGSAFDHAASIQNAACVHRAYGADCIEVIDHDAMRDIATLPGFRAPLERSSMMAGSSPIAARRACPGSMLPR